ncbi:MAG TPA: hypothetical protein VIH61_02500, partial [Waddliaceae bacterium]
QYYKNRSLREVKRQVGGEEKFNELSENEKQSRLEKKEAVLRKADQIIKPKSSHTVPETSSEKHGHIRGKRLSKEQRSSRVVSNATQEPLKNIKKNFKFQLKWCLHRPRQLLQDSFPLFLLNHLLILPSPKKILI